MNPRVAKAIADAFARIENGVIRGSVDLSNLDLTELPDLSQVEVTGNFWGHGNRLTSLQGAPQSVGGDFWCSGNRLTSLRGAPQSVGGNFWCSNNRLTSLRGCPQSVGGGFYCSSNLLTSLRGCPQTVGGNFFCKYNPGRFTAAEVKQALASEQRSAGGLGEAVQALLRL